MQGFVVGFKTLDAGCGMQKPSLWEREFSASPQFPAAVVVFSPLVARGPFCCLSALTAMHCIRRVSWTIQLLPGSASLVVVVVCVA